VLTEADIGIAEHDIIITRIDRRTTRGST